MSKDEKHIIPIEDVKADDDLTRLASGAIYSRSAGKIIGHDGTHTGVMFNSESGRRAALARWEQGKQAMARGIAEGLETYQEDADARKWSIDTWRQIGKALGKAIKSGNTNRLADLVKLAGEYGGFVPSKLDRELMIESAHTLPGYRLIPTTTYDAVIQFAETMQRAIVDGKVIEDDGDD